MRFPIKHTVVYIEIVYKFLTHRNMGVLQFKVDINYRHRKQKNKLLWYINIVSGFFKKDIYCIVIPIALSDITIKYMLLGLNCDRKKMFW